MVLLVTPVVIVGAATGVGGADGVDEEGVAGDPPQDPYTQLILPLIVVLLFNCF